MFAEFNWNEAIGSSPIFMVIVVCSVVALGIAVERVYYYRKRRGDPDGTLAVVLRSLQIGEVEQASWACENSVHPIGRIARQVFSCGNRDRDSVEEQMQIALTQEKMLLEKNLGVLGTLAAVAPLIGLLGTVWGIMRAFSDMATTGSAAPSVVAAGVAEALVTTAAGLVVAVPSLMLYNYFTRRMNVMLTVAENHARSIRSAYAGICEEGAPVADADRSLPWQSVSNGETPRRPEKHSRDRSGNGNRKQASEPSRTR
jgi:biopolymer transport protein ExbB